MEGGRGKKKVRNLQFIPLNYSFSGDDFWFREVTDPTLGSRETTECLPDVGQLKRSAALCQPESDEGAFESFSVRKFSLVLF